MIFDGKKFAIEKEVKLRNKLRSDSKIKLKLVSILIGENPESELYVNLKKKAAERVGIEMEILRFEIEIKIEKIVEQINKLNSDSLVHGIMVQLPLPEKYQERKEEILGAIEPRKDVDCLTPENLGLVMMGKPRFLPATVRAVLEILNLALNKPIITNYQLLITERWLAGKDISVVGASEIVGKPLAMLLSELGATVTLCRSTTSNLIDFTKKADILISAVGIPGLIKKEMVKKGAVVVDVGVTKLKVHIPKEFPEGNSEKLKVVGDVDEEVREVAGFLTPVPGGVGPVTVVSLLENLTEKI